MAVTIVNFAHGTTTDNENGVSTGWGDVALSELGIQQSKKLAELTKSEHFDVVFYSDLQRAEKTAELAFGDRNIEFKSDSRLRECNYGDCNGSKSTIVEPMYLECIEIPFPNGESMKDVETRIAAFLKELKINYDGKCVALVSHKAPQLAFEVLLNGKTWQEAIETDWRHTKAWQPGWEYTLH